MKIGLKCDVYKPIPSLTVTHTRPCTHTRAQTLYRQHGQQSGRIGLIMWGSHAVGGSASPRRMMCGLWAPASRLIRPQFHLEHKASGHLKDSEEMTNYQLELSARSNLKKQLRERRRERKAQLTEERRRRLACMCVCVCGGEIESGVFYKRLSASDAEPITVVPFIRGKKKKKTRSVTYTHTQSRLMKSTQSSAD